MTTWCFFWHKGIYFGKVVARLSLFFRGRGNGVGRRAILGRMVFKEGSTTMTLRLDFSGSGLSFADVISASFRFCVILTLFFIMALIFIEGVSCDRAIVAFFGSFFLVFLVTSSLVLFGDFKSFCLLIWLPVELSALSLKFITLDICSIPNWLCYLLRYCCTGNFCLIIWVFSSNRFYYWAFVQRSPQVTVPLKAKPKEAITYNGFQIRFNLAACPLVLA